MENTVQHDAAHDLGLDLLLTHEEGSVRFTSEDERRDATAALAANGALVVVVPEPSTRGALAMTIDEAIERMLGERGATAACLAPTVDEDADARLADQLYRAKRAGFVGIVLDMPSLAKAARPMGVLEATDAAFLRFYAMACRERAVVVLLREEDTHLGAYGAPMALTDAIFGADVEEEEEEEEAVEQEETEEIVHAHDHDHDHDHDYVDVSVNADANANANADANADADADANADADADANADANANANADVDADVNADVDVEADVQAYAADLESPPPPSTIPTLSTSTSTSTPTSTSTSNWLSFASDLSAARGPQSLTTFCELFVKAYVPLDREIGLGLDDARALEARDDFRRGFARAYTEAFPTLSVRGRRPKMVLDAWDMAHAVSRDSGALRSHVLVVDAMRFDIGAMVERELASELDGRATAVGRWILWSALPTTSARQLETLARGKIALTSPADDLSELDALRGRAADEARRMRVGSRELSKLGLLESRLSAWQHSGEKGVLEIMPTVAKQCAQAIARVAVSLPGRSLLFVTGDRGFTFDADGRLQEGGASPEEVLVPCFALLTGEVH